MNPSINQRLDSMIRAMTAIVIPAISEESSLAGEQARLVLGHLHLLRLQMDDAPRYDDMEWRAMKGLGTALEQAAQGGEKTLRARDALSVALRDCASDPSANPALLRERVGTAVEALIDASSADGDAASRKIIAKLVLRHGTVSAVRDRTWYSATQFEAENNELPSMKEMFADSDIDFTV